MESEIQEYNKFVYFRDFKNNYPNDVPECYNNIIPHDSKVYITKFSVNEVMAFMRR